MRLSREFSMLFPRYLFTLHTTPQHTSRMRRVSSFSEMLPTPRCCCSTCTTWIRPMVRINAGLCSATSTTGLWANCQRPMACGRVMLYVTAYIHILVSYLAMKREKAKYRNTGKFATFNDASTCPSVVSGHWNKSELEQTTNLSCKNDVHYRHR